jgi:hypothetical protein
MKHPAFILSLGLLLVQATSSVAQTNAPNTNRPAPRVAAAAPSFGQVRLERVTKELAAAEKELADETAARKQLELKQNLQAKAGQASAAQKQTWNRQRNEWERGRKAALERKIAGLKLEQIKVREQYKLPPPEAKAARKR